MGKKITNDQKGFIPSSEYTKVPRSQDIILQNNIKHELFKATTLFDELFKIKNNF